MEEENEEVVGMLRKVLSEESSLKKISISVASAVLAASIIGSIVLYKEFIHIQDWADHHEEIAKMHIDRIGALEVIAQKGGRWTLEDHNAYAVRQAGRLEEYARRVAILERSKDLTEFKLETMDDKLDKIIEAIGQVAESRLKGPAM